MAIFEIEGPDGQIYEVDAPDEQSAVGAFQQFYSAPDQGGQATAPEMMAAPQPAPSPASVAASGTPEALAQLAGIDLSALGPTQGGPELPQNLLRDGATPQQPMSPEAQALADEIGQRRAGRVDGRMGKADAWLHGATQGATFGFGDEMAAGLMSMSPNMTYDQALGQVRGSLGQAREDQPRAALASEVLGSLAVPAGAMGATANGGLAARTAIGMGIGSAQGGLYGFGTGEGGFDERRNKAANDAVLGGVIGGAIPGATALGSALVNKLLGRSSKAATVASAPALDDLRNQATAIFSRADQATSLPRQPLTSAFQGMADDAARQGLDDILTPQSARALSRIEDAATAPSQTIGFRDLDILRRQAGIPAANRADKVEAAIGSRLVEGIDDVIESASPQLGGDVSVARDMWGRLRRTEMIDEAMRRAGNAASGVENGLRSQFRAILNDPRRLRGLSKAEISAMERVVKGGAVGNALKKIGKLGAGSAQQSNMLGAGLGAGAGAAVAGPIGAFAVPIVGGIAQKAGERSTQKAAEFARALVASGGRQATAQKAISPLQQLFLEQMLQQGRQAVPGQYDLNIVPR